MTPCASCGFMAVHWAYAWGKAAHGVDPLFAVNLCEKCSVKVKDAIISCIKPTPHANDCPTNVGSPTYERHVR